MEGIIVRILGNLREAWSQVIDLRPRLGSIETNPQFAQMVSPNDMVVLITLETKVADVEGMMNFCIPYITIEPILSKLSAQYWYASVKRGSTIENLKIIKEKLQNIFVETSAELGSMQLHFRIFSIFKREMWLNLRILKSPTLLYLRLERERNFYVALVFRAVEWLFNLRESWITRLT